MKKVRFARADFAPDNYVHCCLIIFLIVFQNKSFYLIENIINYAHVFAIQILRALLVINLMLNNQRI